jgi:hypothetical protein
MKQLRAQLLHLRLGSTALLHRGDLALRPSERQEGDKNEGKCRWNRKGELTDQLCTPGLPHGAGIKPQTNIDRMPWQARIGERALNPVEERHRRVEPSLPVGPKRLHKAAARREARRTALVNRKCGVPG